MSDVALGSRVHAAHPGKVLTKLTMPLIALKVNPLPARDGITVLCCIPIGDDASEGNAGCIEPAIASDLYSEAPRSRSCY